MGDNLNFMLYKQSNQTGDQSCVVNNTKVNIAHLLTVLSIYDDKSKFLHLCFTNTQRFLYICGLLKVTQELQNLQLGWNLVVTVKAIASTVKTTTSYFDLTKKIKVNFLIILFSLVSLVNILVFCVGKTQ